VSLFVLSPEIEHRDEVEVATGQSTKRFSTLNDKYLLRVYYLQAGYKKKSDINFFFAVIKAPVIPISLVPILLVLEGSIILVKPKVYFLTLNGHLAIFDFDICHPCTWTTRVTPQWHQLNIE
jgi:hypothetical protein